MFLNKCELIYAYFHFEEKLRIIVSLFMEAICFFTYFI